MAVAFILLGHYFRDYQREVERIGNDAEVTGWSIRLPRGILPDGNKEGKLRRQFSGESKTAISTIIFKNLRAVLECLAFSSSEKDRWMYEVVFKHAGFER